MIENNLRCRNKTEATEKRGCYGSKHYRFFGEPGLIQNSWYDTGNLPWKILFEEAGSNDNEETRRFEKWTIRWWDCEMPRQ